MEKINDLLNKLYNYDNFGLYLIFAIIVLVILFIVILFFGKKDQKKREVEATKKLEVINEDALKLENTMVKLETTNDLEKTTVVPNIESGFNFDNKVEENKEEISIMDNDVEDVYVNSEDIITNEVNEPVLQKENEIPFSFVEEDNYDHLVTNSDFDLNNPIIEPIKEEIPKEDLEIKSVPEFNFDELVNVAKIDDEVKQESIPVVEEKHEVIEPIVNNGPQVFSSVYAPERKVEEQPKEELEFELPTLKQEFKEESVEVPEVKFEEKEVVPDMVMEPWKEPIPDKVTPKFNSVSLDDLNGESYNLK